MEEFIAMIKLFGGNFAPRGWALCNGQIFSIAQNTALFSILGTTYGGNGQTTFALPNLQGKTAVGAGVGQGGTNYVLGQVAGTESISILTTNMPAHIHPITNVSLTLPANADNSVANSALAGGNRLANSPKTGSGPNAATLNTYTSATANPVYVGGQTATASGQTASTGGSLPISIMQPYLALTYIICLEGIFPSRN